MKLQVSTKGHYDFINITDQTQDLVNKTGVMDGLCLVFVKGSTAAITTLEFEDGIKQDIIDTLEKIAPEDANYKHHVRWGDHNGSAHIKAAWFGPTLTIPVDNGSLLLGTWQQITLIDFDEKPRDRDVYVQVLKG